MSTFGLKYFCEFCSEYKKVLYRVEIACRGYNGYVSEMKATDESPLTITWEKRGDEITEPVKASEATLNIWCFENFAYTNLFTSDPRQYRITIYVDAKLYWRGFLVADNYSETFSAPPYSVSLKAIDGFSILKNLPFGDSNGKQYTGTLSLLNIATKCIDCLELEMPVEEWIGLRISNTDTETLANAYIDSEMLYDVYEECTYRDALELCLKEFAAQIFQAQGVIHIRRISSLISTSRPSSFYINNSERQILENLWQDDRYIDGSAELQITPGLRDVEIAVENKQIKNLDKRMGLYDNLRWSYAGTGTYYVSDSRITFGRGKDPSAKGELTHHGYDVKQCSYTLNYKFSINGEGQDAKFIIKLVGTTGTFYFNGDGWQNSEFVLSATPSQTGSQRVTYNYEDVDYKIEGMPSDGKLLLVLINNTSDVRSGIEFLKFEVALDVDDVYDQSLEIKEIVNNGNNKTMKVDIPLSDIPDIPNNKLMYSLYLLDKDGNATASWIDGYNVDTLINHTLDALRRLKYAPRKQISGKLNCPTTIDLNTLIRDEKYTKSDYYINYLSLNAVDDSISIEINELGRSAESPAQGDDCILEVDLNRNILNAAKCGYKLFLLCEDNVIYIYDTYSATYSKLNYEFKSILDIYDSIDCVVVIDNNKALAFNINGKLISFVDPELDRIVVGPPSQYAYNTLLSASFNGKRNWITIEHDHEGRNCIVAKDKSASYSKSIWIYPEKKTSLIQRDLDSFVISQIDLTKYHDYRLHLDYFLEETIPGESIVDLSKKLLVNTKNGIITFYVRNGISLSASYRQRWRSALGNVANIAVGNDIIALELDGVGITNKLRLYCPLEDKAYKIINLGGNSTAIASLKIVQNYLYLILASGRIWKYVRSENNPELPMTKWSELPRMPQACVDGTAAGIGGKIYMIGGHADKFPNLTNNCFFNIKTKTYTTILNCPNKVCDMAVNSPVIGNCIYVYGGATPDYYNFNISFIQIYNTITNTWSNSSSLPNYPQQSPYSTKSSAVSLNNNIHVFVRNDSKTDGNYHYKYNYTTNTWTSLTKLTSSIEDSVSMVLNSYIYVAGGNDRYGNVSNICLRYDAGLNTWTKIASLNVARSAHVGGIATVNELKVPLITGGLADRDNVTEYYNGSSWTIAEDLSTSECFRNSCSAEHEGALYVFGGVVEFNSNNKIPLILK